MPETIGWFSEIAFAPIMLVIGAGVLLGLGAIAAISWLLGRSERKERERQQIRDRAYGAYSSALRRANDARLAGALDRDLQQELSEVIRAWRDFAPLSDSPEFVPRSVQEAFEHLEPVNTKPL